MIFCNPKCYLKLGTSKTLLFQVIQKNCPCSLGVIWTNNAAACINFTYFGAAIELQISYFKIKKTEKKDRCCNAWLVMRRVVRRDGGDEVATDTTNTIPHGEQHGLTGRNPLRQPDRLMIWCNKFLVFRHSPRLWQCQKNRNKFIRGFSHVDIRKYNWIAICRRFVRKWKIKLPDIQNDSKIVQSRDARPGLWSKDCGPGWEYGGQPGPWCPMKPGSLEYLRSTLSYSHMTWTRKPRNEIVR